MDDLYCSNEKTTESVGVWFWVPYTGSVWFKDGTLKGHGGFVYLLDDIGDWIKTTEVSEEYINKRRR